LRKGGGKDSLSEKEKKGKKGYCLSISLPKVEGNAPCQIRKWEKKKGGEIKISPKGRKPHRFTLFFRREKKRRKKSTRREGEGKGRTIS